MGRHKEYSEKDIQKLGEELLSCVNEATTYHITQFSEEKKKSTTWVYKIAEDYPAFGQYLTRARAILGRKILRLAIEENPSLYIQKTFIKRYLSNEYEDINAWTKEDIEMEAKVKAEAIKSANLAEIDPRFLSFLDYYKKNNEKST